MNTNLLSVCLIFILTIHARARARDLRMDCGMCTQPLPRYGVLRSCGVHIHYLDTIQSLVRGWSVRVNQYWGS